MQTQRTDTGDGGFLTAAFSGNSIPIVFAANNGFVPMFSACLQSLIDHAAEGNNYDVVLLHRDISQENQDILAEQVCAYENISLRFFNTAALLQNYNLKANAHISVETYFRFLIQSILPDRDKVLYMDCDLIINSDVAELFRTDVNGCLLAAARDPEFLGHLHGANQKIRKYILEELKMEDPNRYFQAGVILFNEAQMRRAYSLEQWLSFAMVPCLYNDQDILNKYCEGRVKYLDMSWNLITDCDHTRVSDVISHAPLDIQADYKRARSAPKIIHYAGYRKPWHKPTEDMARYFWAELRKTPYYETVLYTMARGAAQECMEERHRDKSLLWKLRRAVKRCVDCIFPEGSAGRKRIYRIIRRN